MGLWGGAASLEPQADEGGTRRALGLHATRLAVAVALAVATYALFPTAPAVQLPLYEVGSVAGDNVIAPFAFRVPKLASELEAERAAAARATAPVFTIQSSALDSVRRDARQFAAILDAAFAGAPPQAAVAVENAAANAGFGIAAQELAYLRVAPRRRAMFEAVDRVFTRQLAPGVASNASVDDLRGQVAIARLGRTELVSADSIPTFNTLLARSRREHPDPTSEVADGLYVKLVSAFFRPTLVFDRAETGRRRAEAAQAVDADRWLVQAGEKIVGEHEVVGREEHDKMRALRDALQQRGGNASSPARSAARVTGSILSNLVLIAVLGVTLLLYRPQHYRSLRVVLLFAITFALILASAALVARMQTPRPELVPVAIAGVLFSILFDPRISLIAAMVLATLIGIQGPYHGTNALFILLVGGVAAAVSVRSVRRRGQTFYSMLIAAGGYALAAGALGLTLGWTWREAAITAGAGALSAVVSAILAMGLLAPAEELTGIDTYLRLLEWSDLNRPLLQRLSLEAPGTYAHTIAIANLAEAACNAIGANGLLARVGAYYHDIGKVKKPQYFVENQPRGRNPHDKLKPATSASIIRNHVREGLELAEEAKVPKSVRAFITEHHGTGRISYFLEKAKERAEGQPPNPAEFVYPGPTPQTVETAVVMLADGVEAAARVLNDPNPQKLRELVEHVTRQRVEQGQLRDAPLTLRQLEVVKEQFVRVLMGMYHSRIDYPVSTGGVTSEFASA